MYITNMAIQTLELGHGVYSFAEVAKLLKLPRARVREWCVGQRPVLSAGYAPIDGIHAISFLDVVEVHVAAQLRACGVSLQRVRKVHQRLQKDLGTSTPFARRELLTDGKDVFLRCATNDGDDAIYEAITKQHVIPKLILPFLRQLRYASVNSLADRWNVADGVVIDPRYNFGQPMLESCSVPTSVIAAEFSANGNDPERIGGWFGITATDVMHAIRFEKSLAA